ncbi:MAG: hypothetical protein EBV15_05615 [Bacteroidetes bacterium]|nr:hypothetical protein [Bacteroidota bacterium]
MHGQIQYPSKSNYFVQNNTAIGSTGYFKIKNYVDSLVFDSLSKGIDHYSYYSSDSSKKYHVKSDNQRTWIKFNDTGYTKIFDFTLNSSDSFRFYYTPNSNHIISWTWVKIDSTSSIKINGINHKCIYTSPLGFLKFQFVQGVGTLQRGINYWQFGGTGRPTIPQIAVKNIMSSLIIKDCNHTAVKRLLIQRN